MNHLSCVSVSGAAAVLAVASACGSAAFAQCQVSLAPAVNFGVGGSPAAVAIGDVNGDGLNDVVVGHSAGSNLSVFLNNGSGGLQPRMDFPGGGGQLYSVVLARINADTALDVVVSTSGGLRLHLNNGAGIFGPPTTFAGASNMRQAVVADLNMDGLPDVAAASNEFPQGVAILINNGSGALIPMANLPLGLPAYGVGVFDYDGDNIPDIVASSSGGSGVYRFKGNGGGTFQASVLACPGVGGTMLTLADITGDGRPDGFVPFQAGAFVHVLENIGGGNFVQAGTVPAPSLGGARNVAVVDMNNDGLRDMLAPINGGANLTVFSGQSPSTFGAGVAFPTGAGPLAVAVGDITGDGRPDAVVANSSGASISLLAGLPSVAITTNPTPQTVDFGDNTVLTVSAVGAATFSWRRNGVPLSNGGHYSGADTATLTIIETTNIEAGTYDCVVSAGGCSVTSAGAAVSVVPGCGSPDFDGDGDPGTDLDIEAFFRVLGGGSC